MIRNYLTVAIRSFLKHRSFTFLNWIGLTLGMIVLDTLSGSSPNVRQRWVEFLTANGIPEHDAAIIYAVRNALLHGYGPPTNLDKTSGRKVVFTDDPHGYAVDTTQPGLAVISVPVFCSRLVERIATAAPDSWDVSEVDTALADPDVTDGGEPGAFELQRPVPMGAELPPPAAAGQVPVFRFEAMKDPLGANLDRIQVVKGWVDSEGDTHAEKHNAEDALHCYSSGGTMLRLRARYYLVKFCARPGADRLPHLGRLGPKVTVRPGCASRSANVRCPDGWGLPVGRELEWRPRTGTYLC